MTCSVPVLSMTHTHTYSVKPLGPWTSVELEQSCTRSKVNKRTITSRVGWFSNPPLMPLWRGWSKCFHLTRERIHVLLQWHQNHWWEGTCSEPITFLFKYFLVVKHRTANPQLFPCNKEICAPSHVIRNSWHPPPPLSSTSCNSLMLESFYNLSTGPHPWYGKK
jgi:hypothetical protein